jgi:hypothetical protein
METILSEEDNTYDNCYNTNSYTVIVLIVA